tara:strand:- start:10 stop:255 length:246 start_codon:yes stop_codon:yes gene_type:complete
MARYGKIKGDNCFFLTKNGREVAIFDNENDVDSIIDMENNILRNVASLLKGRRYLMETKRGNLNAKDALNAFGLSGQYIKR